MAFTEEQITHACRVAVDKGVWLIRASMPAAQDALAAATNEFWRNKNGAPLSDEDAKELVKVLEEAWNKCLSEQDDPEIIGGASDWIMRDPADIMHSKFIDTYNEAAINSLDCKICLPAGANVEPVPVDGVQPRIFFKGVEIAWSPLIETPEEAVYRTVKV